MGPSHDSPSIDQRSPSECLVRVCAGPTKANGFSGRNRLLPILHLGKILRSWWSLLCCKFQNGATSLFAAISWKIAVMAIQRYSHCWGWNPGVSWARSAQPEAGSQVARLDTLPMTAIRRPPLAWEEASQRLSRTCAAPSASAHILSI